MSQEEWELLRAAGYEPRSPFAAGRFLVGMASAPGRPGRFVYKVNVPPTSPRRLLRQSAFDQALNSAVTRAGRARLVRAPFLELVPGFTWPRVCAIFHHFNGRALVPRRRAEMQLFLCRIPDVAAVLVFLDSLDGEILDREDLWTGGDRVRIPDRRAQWALAAGLLTTGELHNLQEIAHAGDQEVRFQHGDFVPWHLSALDDGALGLIDSEWGGVGYARFWDLAYIYHRVFTRLHAPAVARRLLQEFLVQSGLDRGVLAEGLLPVLASRAVNGLYECLASQTEWAKGREWAKLRRGDKRVLGGHAEFKAAVMERDIGTLL